MTFLHLSTLGVCEWKRDVRYTSRHVEEGIEFQVFWLQSYLISCFPNQINKHL